MVHNPVSATLVTAFAMRGSGHVTPIGPKELPLTFRLGREPPRRYAGANVGFDIFIARSRQSALSHLRLLCAPKRSSVCWILSVAAASRGFCGDARLSRGDAHWRALIASVCVKDPLQRSGRSAVEPSLCGRLNSSERPASKGPRPGSALRAGPRPTKRVQHGENNSRFPL